MGKRKFPLTETEVIMQIERKLPLISDSGLMFLNTRLQAEYTDRAKKKKHHPEQPAATAAPAGPPPEEE